MPDRIVTLSHPDSNRRPRNYTGSADLSAFTESARGLSTLWLIYRRWGISPRPENVCARRAGTGRIIERGTNARVAPMTKLGGARGLARRWPASAQALASLPISTWAAAGLRALAPPMGCTHTSRRTPCPARRACAARRAAADRPADGSATRCGCDGPGAPDRAGAGGRRRAALCGIDFQPAEVLAGVSQFIGRTQTGGVARPAAPAVDVSAAHADGDAGVKGRLWHGDLLYKQ